MPDSWIVWLGGATLIVALGLAFRAIVRSGKRQMEAQRTRFEAAKPAQARVLQVGKSVAQVRNGTVIVKLRLEVSAAGSASYGVSTVWEIQQTAIPQVQAGQVLSVRIDADDQRIIYPAAGWASFDRLHWDAWVNRD